MANHISIEKTANILVMGGTGSGKTVAACCSFGGINLNGYVGKKVKFQLTATDQKDSDELMRRYAAMFDNELPLGSTHSDVYEFSFEREREGICKIRWMDYRGALTRDKNNEEEKEYYDDFLLMLEHASLLIYIISGDVIDQYLASKEMDNRKKIKTKIEIANQVAQLTSLWQTVNGVRGTDDQTPILFYVTKSDKIRYDDDKKKLEALRQFLEEYALLIPGRRILGCHSTLGRDIKLSDDGNEIIAGFEPEGFEIPVMLTVGYALSQAGRKWEQEERGRVDALISSLQSEQRQLTQEAGRVSGQLGYKLRNLFRMENSQRKELERKIEEAWQKMTQLQKEQQQIADRNEWKSYSRDILHYIEKELKTKGTYAAYLSDEKGEQRPLSAFFE